MTKIEKLFEAIGEELLENAEAVDCSMKEFYDGLRSIRASIDNRLLVEREEADYL